MNGAIYSIIEHEWMCFTRQMSKNFWIQITLSVKQCNSLFRFLYIFVLLFTDSAALRVFERRALSKILGPVWAGHDFRIRCNSEFLNYMDIVQRINMQWLCRLGYVFGMADNIPKRRVFDAKSRMSCHRLVLSTVGMADNAPERRVFDAKSLMSRYLLVLSTVGMVDNFPERRIFDPKSRMSRHGLVLSTVVGVREIEAPSRMC